MLAWLVPLVRRALQEGKTIVAYVRNQLQCCSLSDVDAGSSKFIFCVFLLPVFGSVR